MTTEIIDGITKLTASAGKVLVDQDGVAGRVVWLGAGRAATDFAEVDEALPDAVDAAAAAMGVML